jgi:hypothetical protein
VTWYIDAIDPRGGRAVAAQRSSDLVRGSRLEENAAVAFIGAPLFEPEFIGSRSLGLSMSRLGHSQLGLFLEDEEVPFDSLDAVAEFVRRSYVRGSGGDGAGEGGVPPLPAAPDRGDDGFDSDGIREFESDEKHDVVARVLNFSAFIEHLTNELKLGESRQPERFSSADYNELKASHLGIQRLTRGAVRTLREVVRRCPRFPRSAEYLNWCRTLDRVIYMISALGLWAQIRREIRGSPGDARRWLMTEPDELAPRTYRRIIDLLVEVDDTSESRVRWRPYAFEFLHYSQDPVADLASVPVASKYLANVPQDGRNLLSILSLMTATPGDLLTVNGYGNAHVNEARAELALFAAAYLNLGNERPNPRLEDVTMFMFLGRLLSRTEQWLSANFPRRVFAPEVENVIVSCSLIAA